MEAEAYFVFSIGCLDKADPLSDEKLREIVMVTLELKFTVVADRSDRDALVVLRFADLFREPPG